MFQPPTVDVSLDPGPSLASKERPSGPVGSDWAKSVLYFS